MTDPSLLQVFAAGKNLQLGRGTLHRVDEDARCNRAPENHTVETDLTTAAVANDIDSLEGHDLCDYCEWPDGAEEVLQDG